jgi:hypothetical protein
MTIAAGLVVSHYLYLYYNSESEAGAYSRPLLSST